MSVHFEFSGKTVFVSGASGGIGFAIAKQFACAGAHVVFHCSGDTEKASTLLTALPGEGHRLFPLDLSVPQSIAAAMTILMEQINVVDVLVNNAGVFPRHVVDECDFTLWDQAWERCMRINLLAPAHLIHSLVPYMRKQGGGKIINITSRGAFRGEPEAPAYGASKAGLNALSQSLAKRLARYNIHVYAVAPGFTETARVAPTLQANPGLIEEIPLGRVASPDEVARTVLFLASPGQESLTGGIVDINGASYLRS